MHLPLVGAVATALIALISVLAASPSLPTPIARRRSVAEAIYVRRPVSRGIASSISINEKRDLDAQGLGRFLAPNESSVNAACYPLYIEVFAPGPPHNLTAWFQKGTRQLSQTIFEWPRVDNPWVNENVSLSVTWERLSIGPGSLASIIVQGYLDDVAESAPFTVQPSNDRSCYNGDFTGDATWGTTTGGGITTTYAPSVPNTYTDSDPLPTALPAGQENTYRPNPVDTAGSSSPTQSAASPGNKTSVVGPVIGGVVGTLGVVGVGLGIWFWLRRKKKAEKRVAAMGKGGATTAGDEAPYVVDMVGDESGESSPGGMREAGAGGRPQLQAYTYGSGSGQGNVHDSSTPFMSRGATSDENLRVHTGSGVVQERDSGMRLDHDTVPPDYADATASSPSRTGGSTYFQSPSSAYSSGGPNFTRSPSASTPSEVSDGVRRGSGKTMRG